MIMITIMTKTMHFNGIDYWSRDYEIDLNNDYDYGIEYDNNNNRNNDNDHSHLASRCQSS